MIKGTSQNILCDKCRRIITDTNYITILGKKRVLHYCNDEKCLDFDRQIENLGYKKLSEQTWEEHCEKCKSHLSGGCVDLMPNCNEFFNHIIFQKRYDFGNVKNVIIEIARPKKINKGSCGNSISEYSVGFVFVNPKNYNVVRRMFWELMDRKKLISFIKQCEEEVNNTIEWLQLAR